MYRERPDYHSQTASRAIFATMVDWPITLPMQSQPHPFRTLISMADEKLRVTLRSPLPSKPPSKSSMYLKTANLSVWNKLNFTYIHGISTSPSEKWSENETVDLCLDLPLVTLRKRKIGKGNERKKKAELSLLLYSFIIFLLLLALAPRVGLTWLGSSLQTP